MPILSASWRIDKKIALDELAAAHELTKTRESLTQLHESLCYYDREKQAIAGCVISIDFEGHVDTIIGIVAKGDQKKIARIDAKHAAERA